MYLFTGAVLSAAAALDKAVSFSAHTCQCIGGRFVRKLLQDLFSAKTSFWGILTSKKLGEVFPSAAHTFVLAKSGFLARSDT